MTPSILQCAAQYSAFDLQQLTAIHYRAPQYMKLHYSMLQQPHSGEENMAKYVANNASHIISQHQHVTAHRENMAKVHYCENNESHSTSQHPNVTAHRKIILLPTVCP